MLNSLDITELKIFPVKEQVSDTIAFCTATFNSALVVSGIRIREGKQGIYIAYPMYKSKGNRFPIVCAANEEARKEISNRILATYVINYCVEDFAA